jgi:hypothetical protein
LPRSPAVVASCGPRQTNSLSPSHLKIGAPCWSGGRASFATCRPQPTGARDKSCQQRSFSTRKGATLMCHQFAHSLCGLPTSDQTNK